MSNLHDTIISLGNALSQERDAAFDLWTWLPSYAVATAAHGDHAGNHFPGVEHVLREAAVFIGMGLKKGDVPTAQQIQEAGGLFDDLPEH